MKLVEVVSTVSTADDVAETARALCAQVGKVAGLLRRPRRLHRQRAAVPLPQRRGEDARGALRDRRRHRHRDEVRLRAADGPVRAARRGRQRRVAGHPARALPGVPRARASPPRRCSSTWSRPATSAARPGAASATTPSADRRRAEAPDRLPRCGPAGSRRSATACSPSSSRSWCSSCTCPTSRRWHALGDSATGFLTYLLSFVYVGIYWNNHHHMFQVVEHVTGGVLWANLHLLFWLSLLPFSTAWMDETRLRADPDDRLRREPAAGRDRLLRPPAGASIRRPAAGSAAARGARAATSRASCRRVMYLAGIASPAVGPWLAVPSSWCARPWSGCP